MTVEDRPIEIIGFGALNLDYIASASKLSVRVVDLVRESTARFEWGVESAVDEQVVYQAIERLGTASLDAALGGSAWNTIYALAQARLGLRLGYVGSVGRTGVPGLSFLRQMDLLGIDHRFVGRDLDRLCGVCLSYIEDGERVLLTYPGANAELAGYIGENLEALADEDGQIEDATGAGDTFAAGLLASAASRRLRTELGALLGMRLARHRLEHGADKGIGAFSQLADGFMQAGEGLAGQTAFRPQAVFIAHGIDPQWRLLQQFVEEECGIPVHTHEREGEAEDPGAAISRCLERCSFAACVLTAQDQMSHGAGRAEQHVVHQAGLSHGRYGFGRVAILVEEGCELFSNVSGLVRLDFPRGQIDTTFWRLGRMLRREGLLG